MTPARARFAGSLAVACILVAVLVAWSLAIGAYGLTLGEVWRALWSAVSGTPSGLDAAAQSVVVEVRAPRVIAALAIGAALSVAGGAFQNLFRNPLVSPDILGISSGCALGAVIAILAGWTGSAVQVFAFAGGLVAAALVIAIGAWVRAHDRVLTLVLTGVIVGSLFGAAVAFAKTLADPFNQLPAMTFWLLGSFAAIEGKDLALALPLIVVGAVALAVLRWRIDVLALPEDEARALGVDVDKVRLVVIAAATLMTSASVAIAGIIGWIGLVVPHLARLAAGPSFARVLPLSAAFGAAILLAVDTLCRIATESELPPGAVTALVGTPVFIVLLATGQREA
ncbi:MAG: FecCD family ABC transporter permease [Bacillota bacterium]